MKKYQLIIFSFIIRIIGCIICIYLINKNPIIDTHSRCVCVGIGLFTAIYLFAAAIGYKAGTFLLRFFATLVSTGISSALGFYFMHLSHSIVGLYIIAIGIAYSFGEHYDAINYQKDVLDKDEAKS